MPKFTVVVVETIVSRVAIEADNAIAAQVKAADLAIEGNLAPFDVSVNREIEVDTGETFEAGARPSESEEGRNFGAEAATAGRADADAALRAAGLPTYGELLRALERLTHPAADDDDLGHALTVINSARGKA